MMMRNRFFLMCTALMFAAMSGIAFAGPDCPSCEDHSAPAAKAAQVQLAADGKAALPEGHPPLDKMGGQNQKLPEGHPTPDQMKNSALGTLVIKGVVQKADGETVPAAGAVAQIELYQRGKKFHELAVKLDDSGVNMIEEIAIQGVVQPIVTLIYDGVPYRKVTHPMAVEKPDQIVKMSVYEATDEQPDWEVKVRHVIARNGPHGVEVTEMMLLHSPAKRAWRGESGGEGERPVTFELNIPKNAKFVQFGPKTDPAMMEIKPGKIISHAPLVPGDNELAIGFVLPPDDGKVSLDIGMPTRVGHMMLFVEDDGTDVTVEGMAGGKTMQGHGGKAMKVYTANNVAKDADVSLTIEGITTPAPTQPEGAAGAPVPVPNETNVAASTAPKWIAGIGGAGILLVALGMVVLRHSPRSDDTTEQG